MGTLGEHKLFGCQLKQQCKSNDEIFFRQKAYIFAKLLLMSFMYKLVETFYFPNKKTIEIYNKYNIKRIFPYPVLTDTDST